MTNILPYSIHHIYMDKMEDIFLEKKINSYLVFWWRSIPLGHLFVDTPEQITEVNFKQKIIKIISSTINQYNSDKNLSDKYERAFTKNDRATFYGIMDEIFLPVLSHKKRLEVPVSVVICTRNRSHSLQKCIRSLINQNCLPQEIIVVDNAPSDDSTFSITAQFPSVIYCKEMRAGLDFARNAGAKKAASPIVAYVDDDVLVHPDWCYRVWEAFNDVTIGAVTGLIIATSLVTESQQIFEKHWGFNKGYKEILFDKNFLKSSAPKVWDIGAGANMAFRKSILEELNYFDERLDVGAAGCSGDSEIWYRMLLAGKIIRYAPTAVAYHAHRETIEQLHKQLFHYMRGSVVAAFIQHKYSDKSGYKKYVYFELPKYYFLLLRQGFPNYSFRYKTIFTEIRGIISGIKFYYKNDTNPSLHKK